MTSKKSLLLISLLLSGCGTNNNNNNSSGGGGAPSQPASDDRPSASVSIPPALTKDPAKELEITNGSVVDSKKHVIVNAANKWLAPGGVLSGAIFGAAGSDKVLAEIASKHGGVSYQGMIEENTPLLETSKVFTTGAYDLSKNGTQYIIHALGPDFRVTPYKGDMELGYTDLRQTYKNVYAEMDRLNKEHQVPTMGLIPISAGVFAGGADKTKLYEIMVEETLSALHTFPALQPELYLFSKDEYDAVKKVLLSVVSKSTPPSMLSSGVGTSLSKLALMESSTYQAQLCSDAVKGAAVSFGSVRIMGSIVENPTDKKTQLIVGDTHEHSFLGCELETAYRNQEHAYFSVKATGAMQISDSLKLSGGLGYMRENMAHSLSRNVRNFLNLDNKDYERQGVVCDVIAQHQVNLSSTLSFTTNVGIKGEYMGEVLISPFVHISCNIEGLGVSAIMSQQEFGFNFNHYQ
jgi:O-acetyl-ADP-ribose deacetylase (regulator of RNase III)